MPCQPRLVIPGHPHHVTQRGNRREPVFFQDEDYAAYLYLLREWADRAGTQVWA
jgi:putative transposase